MLISLLIACSPTPCMSGFGRDAAGACVALAGQGAAPGDGGAAPADTDSEPDGGDDGGADASTDTAITDTEETTDTSNIDTGPGSTDTAPTSSPPLLTPAEVEQRLELLLSPGLPSVYDYTAAWRTLVDEGRDEMCPGREGYSVAHGIKGCVSNSGYHYAGPMIYDVIEEDEREALIFSADGYITTPDGDRFTAGGNVSIDATRQSDGWDWITDLNGIWSYPPAGGWLGSGVSTYLSCVGSSTSAGDEAVCTGGYSLDDVDAALYLDHLTLSTGCASGEGSLLLRDADGGWYDLSLSCGDCGQLTYDGHASMGSICPDLSALSAFLSATTSTW